MIGTEFPGALVIIRNIYLTCCHPAGTSLRMSQDNRKEKKKKNPRTQTIRRRGGGEIHSEP